MLLAEAVDLLKSGKFVARESWQESGEYLIWLVGAEHLFKVSRVPSTTGAGYALTFKDACAEDWIEMTHDAISAFEPKVVA